MGSLLVLVRSWVGGERVVVSVRRDVGTPLNRTALTRGGTWLAAVWPPVVVDLRRTITV